MSSQQGCGRAEFSHTLDTRLSVQPFHQALFSGKQALRQLRYLCCQQNEAKQSGHAVVWYPVVNHFLGVLLVTEVSRFLKTSIHLSVRTSYFKQSLLHL